VIGNGSKIGSYRITCEIGSGGMGTVYEAVHVVLGRRVAIKVLHLELRDIIGMDTRMLQEAKIVDELRSPGIVRLFDCGVLADGCPWLAMELVEGESLAGRLSRDTVLPPDEVCRLVGSIAGVLATVHEQGIVHRDLKPDNILFADPATGCDLRIIDWGVARLDSAARLTLEGFTCGTPIYMSPEQATGRDIAAPCDIYSLGVIAYEALTGEPPFDGRSLAEVVSLHLYGEAKPLSTRCPDAPPELCALVHRMLGKVPSQRPTAAEVAETLRVLAPPIEAIAPFIHAHAAPDGRPADPTMPFPMATTRIRWTPSMPSTFGQGMICPNGRCWEVCGEIRRTH
jgi:serine/threonine-protein kinase